MASGQAVRRLTLDQEIVGSNPTSPAIFYITQHFFIVVDLTTEYRHNRLKH